MEEIVKSLKRILDALSVSVEAVDVLRETAKTESELINRFDRFFVHGNEDRVVIKDWIEEHEKET